MKPSINLSPLFGELFSHAWRHRRILFGTALFHRLLALILFWPMLSWLIQRLVLISGESALSNEAIAQALLSPAGVGGALLCVAMGVAIVAIEQSSLMAQNFVHRHGNHLSIPQAMQFSLRRGGSTFSLVLRILLLGVAMTAPFLGALAGVAWLLLGDHDINFYLSERPTKFYVALTAAAIIFGCALLIVLPRLASWSLALPLKLLFDLSPSQALKASRLLVWPQRWHVARIWLLWLVVHFVLSSLLSVIVYQLAYLIVPYSLSWFPLLLITLGGFFLVYLLGSTILSLFQAVSFAVLCVGLHQRFAWPDGDFSLPTGLGPFPNRESVLSDVLRATPKTRHPQPDQRELIASDQRLDRGSRRWLWIAAGLALCSCVAGYWLANAVTINEKVLVIAHRGAAGSAPENTLAAFERAIQDGADFVELDVMESADGQVVVFHDKDYMKVAGVSAKVWEATFAELAKIDIGSHFDPKFNDQRTPLLAEALRLCKDRTKVMIELKEYGRGERLVERVIEIVEQEQMADQIVVMSLNLNLVRETQRARPDWTVGFLAAVSVGPLAEVDVDFLAVNAKVASRQFISQAQRRNKGVYVWTINSPESMIHYLTLGVDGIITDYPDRARQAIDFFNELGPAERLLLEASLRLGIVPIKPPPPASDRDA